MGLKIFITGACGYLGNVLTTQLASMPEVEQITGMDITTQTSTSLPPKVKLIQMDIRSPKLADAMTGYDVVVHTAFIVLWSKKMPETVRDDINFNGTRNVAQAAIKNRVHKFVHASSVAAYDHHYMQGKEPLSENCPIGKGDSFFYYGNSKALTEKMLLEILAPTDILLTMFRMPYIIGPKNRVTVSEFRENAVLFPGKNPCTQFVHENDVAQAFAQSIRTNMPGAFNVAPDDSIKYRDLYGVIGAKPRTVPFWLARLMTFIRWNYLGSAMHPAWLEGLLYDSFISNKNLKATGWSPQYSSADAIRSALVEGPE